MSITILNKDDTNEKICHNSQVTYGVMVYHGFISIWITCYD